MPEVGVRELRQNLSAYLRRVRSGEAFTVTDRGEEVASLHPAERYSDPVKKLIAERGAMPARLDLLTLGPPLRLPAELGPTPASDILMAEREEQRRREARLERRAES